MSVVADGSPGFSAYFQAWVDRSGLKPMAGTVSAKGAALVIVDMQNDFVGEFTYTTGQHSPCAAFLNSTSAPCFGVPEGVNASDVIVKILGQHRFDTVLVSGDDHSPSHCSFAVEGGTLTPAPACASILSQCTQEEGECQGTEYIKQLAHVAGKSMTGPFPPHCERGHLGAAHYAPILDALTSYWKDSSFDAPRVFNVVKGLNLGTDSFGVFQYSLASRAYYSSLGLLDFNTSGGTPKARAPAALYRSMLTW